MNTKIWNAFMAENENTEFATMAKAVIEQLGGVDEYTLDELNTITNGSDGYTGFIWYTETCEFYRRNAETIKANMHELADDLDEGLIEMVSGFGSVKGNYSYDEIGSALYGPFHYDMYETNMYLYDTFAKYALEEVANRFQNFVYENGEDDEE